MPTSDQFLGCVFGLALGDAMGAPFEGGPLERMLWRLIGRTKHGELRWTDDTQMSIDLMESLIAHGRVDQDDLAHRFAASYRWTRGYGPGAAKILKRIRGGMPWTQANRSVHAEGSFGNGAAMRAPIIGVAYADRPAELDQAARDSAIVTHAHPLGIEGAVLIARATATVINIVSSATAPPRSAGLLREMAECCKHDEFTSRLAIAADWLETNGTVTNKEIAPRLGNGIAAHQSCVTAVYFAMRFLASPFLEMHRAIVECGGDVDTIAAMAGAIWGAARGAEKLPPEPLEQLEQRERLTDLAMRLHQRFAGR